MDAMEDHTRRGFLVEGILFAILGILAIILPGLFTIAVVSIFAWLLIIGGIIRFVRSFQNRQGADFFLSMLLGILYLVIGVYLLLHPLINMLAVTLLLGSFFVVEGIFKSLWAFQLRHVTRWASMLFSGVISIILGGLLLAGLPGTAVWAVGLLLGINLLFFGISLIALGTHTHRLGQI